MALLAFGLFLIFTWSSEAVVERNVDSVEWLPPEASNISYIERTGMGGVKIAEFSIPQSDFNAFCEKNGWILKHQNDANIYFRNYIRSKDDPEVDRPFDEYRVENALFYEDRKANGGGITLVYDLDAGRGYYFYSHN